MGVELRILAMVLPILILSGFDAASMKFTNVICESLNKSWVVFNECRLRVAKRNMITFNLNATLLHPANVVNINTQVLKKANGYKPWLINVTFDFCEYTRKHHIPYINLVVGLIKNVTNLDQKCPFNGTFFVKNLHVRPENLRLPLPSGEYLLLTNWMFNRKLQFITKLYFAFVEDLINA